MTVLEAQLKAIKDKEHEGEIDDIDVLEWLGGKDRGFNFAYDSEAALISVYNEH